ncbi:MAG: RNA 2',3'-cyclic phosphodiesterase [Candidatus Hydrogenedentes bacterium]|nr:RNA 2',3'-cyclic phosphodiesterase [Candidatus Hydrogenedentota bacterium]
MRAFIAIELPDSVKKGIAALQERLRKSGVAAAWTKPENFHLTLRFLGDVDEERIASLRDFLREHYGQCGALQLCFQGAGAFPDLRRPNVLWAGLRVLEGDLVPIQAVAEAGAVYVGLAREGKAFLPHVTLARLRDRRRFGDCREALARCAALGGDAFPVRAVALFSSQLDAAGAIHRRIEEFPFT